MGTPDVCEVWTYDAAKVARLRQELPDVERLAEVFAALADPTRARIVWALSREELCVCEIAEVVGLSMQAVSYHLRLLRALRLVRHRKAGRLVFYALDDEHVRDMVAQSVEHLAHATAERPR